MITLKESSIRSLEERIKELESRLGRELSLTEENFNLQKLLQLHNEAITNLNQ